MNSAAKDRFPLKKNNPLVSWEFVILKFLLILLICVLVEKPAGSIAGRLALQQEGFNLFSYDMKSHHVYAIAIGPRGKNSQERGVWVGQDGTFRIDRLPVGEYELKVHVPGFATSYDSGIFVNEGETTQLNHDVALELEHPSVSVASNNRVFTTTEQPRFWISANGCSKAVVRVYKQDSLAMLRSGAPKKYGFDVNQDMSIYKPYEAEKKATALDYFKTMQPVREWTRELATDSSDYSHTEFKFEKPLPVGDYFAVAEVSNVQNARDWNVLSFSVTDLGLIIKRDPWQTLVRSINLNTLKPEQGVKVEILNRDAPGTVLASGVTGVDGFAKISRAADASTTNEVVYGSLSDQHAVGGLNYYHSETDSYQTYFYTDRPVYRLGQTVYFKGIARAKDLEGFKNPGGNLKLEATVEDPDNNPVWKGPIKTSEHGTFHGVFEVPKDGKTGAYQVTIKYPDNSQAYERFEVAEYRKPEYMVEVLPVEPRQIAGSKVRARIRANYYFGAPVANAKVKYTIYSSVDWESRYRLMDRPSYYSYFDDWDNGGYDSSYSGDYIGDGIATTDDNGEAIVEFDTKKNDFNKDDPSSFDCYDHRYKIEAEVTDLSRLSVLGSGALQVTNGDFALFVKPDRYVARVGEPISADFSATTYDRKPVANQPVHLELYRRKYDHNRYQFVGIEKYEDVTVTTDSLGKGHVDFHTKPEFVTDNYGILAYSNDSKGNMIADQGSVWVVSEHNPYVLSDSEAQKEPLTVKLDKDVYQPGDVAKVMITAPVTGQEGGEAIVSVEGAKLYDYKVVPLKATAQMVELPLKLDYAPNVYVNVTFVGKKHQFYNQMQAMKVSPAQRFLNLVVESDKNKYKPGETANYTIKAQYADGKPAANTEVSLGIVDESIYAIRPDSTPDIRKFFYSRRDNLVTTTCSFPEEYSGGPNKIEPRMRKDFRDTAAWIPELVTDANGVAKASIKLPDNLTTWRATARAVSMNTEVGWAIQKVVATQDLIVRIALPRFFTQDDQGFITAVVHNYTDKPQGVQLTLAATKQFDVRDSLIQKMIVMPDKALRYSWPVRVVGLGDAVVSCKAVGDTAGDAMETKIPVHPHGVASFAARSGVLDSDDVTTSIPMDIPPDAVPGSVKYHVYLSSSSLGALVGNFGSLIDYPYGCTEQTMSKLFPSIVAMRLNQTLGMPLSKEDKKRFGEVYKQSMAKLDGYQHEDGGWGWWADDTSQIYLTSLVLDGYRLLRDAGYAVPQERQDNGKKWLSENTQQLFKQYTDPLRKKDRYSDIDTEIDLARGTFVLSEYGVKVPANVKKWALSNRDHLSPETLAYFAMALQKSGASDEAQSLYQAMVEMGHKTDSQFGSTLDWAPSRAMLSKLGLPMRDYWYSFRYTPVESSALALEAVAAIDPTNRDRIELIKRFIFQSRGKDGWENTKTTAQVLRAVMDAETGADHSLPASDFKADLTLAGQAPQSFTFDKASMFQKDKDVSVEPSGKSVNVTLHKAGTGRLYYNCLLTYYRAIKPGQYLAEKSLPEGLSIKREFFRLVPTGKDSNGNIHFTAKALTDRKVKAGETILMKMYVSMPYPVPYCCMEAPLPSGAEVVENDSRENAEEENKDNSSNYFWGNWWWSHQDVMDDHLAFFVDNFARGTAELHQMIRMEIPGKFQLNPASLEGMYTKAVRSYSQADEIEVVE